MRMAKILISNSFPTQPILRQIPRRTASWMRHEFVLDDYQSNEAQGSIDVESVDAWVVYDDLKIHRTMLCPRARTLLITGEPPSIRRYHRPFTNQFGAIRTSHSNVHHPHGALGHEAQPWHYGLYPSQTHGGVLDCDAIAELPCPAKPKLLSVISSNKVVTEGHRQRLAFVQQLREAFGTEIDVFGRGIRDVSDKSDAIWNYRYHIVLENDHSDHYMSEKLMDGFLGWSFPFYSGGKTALETFPAGSFAPIDIYRPAEAIAIIRQHMEQRVAEQRRELIAQARGMVLNELNLFKIIGDYYDAMESRLNSSSWAEPGSTKTTLWPKKRWFPLQVHRLMRAISLAA